MRELYTEGPSPGQRAVGQATEALVIAWIQMPDLTPAILSGTNDPSVAVGCAQVRSSRRCQRESASLCIEASSVLVTLLSYPTFSLRGFCRVLFSSALLPVTSSLL